MKIDKFVKVSSIIICVGLLTISTYGEIQKQTIIHNVYRDFPSKPNPDSVFNFVDEHYSHSEYRPITFLDNWIMYGLGVVYRPFRDSQDASLLLSKGTGFCSQAALIYVSILKQHGYKARFVQFDGHVAAEVLTNTWKYKDIDYSVQMDMNSENFDPVQALDVYRQKNINTRQFNTLSKVFSGKVVHTDYPSSPKRYRIEQAADIGKVVLPITGIVFMLRKRFMKIR